MAGTDFNGAADINGACQCFSTVTKVMETIGKVRETVTLACSITLTNEIKVLSCDPFTIINNLKTTTTTWQFNYALSTNLIRSSSHYTKKFDLTSG